MALPGGDLTWRCADAEYLKKLYDVCGPSSGIDASHISVEMNSLYG